MNENEDQVVIVGGGPVGLVTAMFLAKHGLRSTVLEKENEVPKDLRASTFHPPTLDMLDTIGVTGGLIEQGLICPTWQFRDRQEGEVATFDLGHLKNDTAHPYRLQCEQWKLSEMLRDRAEDSDMIRIVFGAEAVEIAQDDDRASVTVSLPDGARQTHRGRYVIGADGAGSPVRKSAGITLEGATIPELFLSMSTPFQFHDAIPDLANIAYITDPDEWVVLLRTPTLWRILVPNDPDQPAREMHDPANMNARIQALCPWNGFYEIAHSTAYRVQQRVANRYFAGRTIVVGDAAHLNNPLGGMGLNGGIHDAVNLAEKLAAIWAGGSPEQHLATYEIQRRKVAMDTVQEQSLRNRRMMAEKDPAQRRRYHDELRRTVADPVAHHAYVLKSSMIASLRDAEAAA